MTRRHGAPYRDRSQPLPVRVIDAEQEEQPPLPTEGALPYRKVGKHRRILMEAVRRNKNRTDRAREAVLDQLAAEAQENGMGYPGL